MSDWKKDLIDASGRYLAPESPPWRNFPAQCPWTLDLPAGQPELTTDKARKFVPNDRYLEVVRGALFLRRPLLITGKPGLGKSTLAHYVAHELNLGPVLKWAITSRTTLRDGLYQYDAVARLQELQRRQFDETLKNRPPGPDDEGRFFTLGPLGTALLPWKRPRVLLIDEIDKSDLDFPNDLLHVFEDGFFEIPELRRLPPEIEDVPVDTADPERWRKTIPVTRGMLRCHEFPFIIMTSNGERDFPPAFRRRCIPLVLDTPSKEELSAILASHFGESAQNAEIRELAGAFAERLEKGDNLATDQLLNQFFLRRKDITGLDPHILRDLSLPDALEDEKTDALDG